MKQKKIILIIVILLVLFSIVVPISAKYINNIKKSMEIQGSEMYFSSDLLEEPSISDTYPKYTLSEGTNTIVFKLKNYIDDLRFSELDITYNIKVYNSLDTLVHQENGEILYSSSKQEKDITISGLNSDKYTVIVTSMSPYVVTLKGEFTILESNDDFTYVVSDGIGSSIVQVVITVTDFEGKINIKWPTGVSPDISNPLLSGAVDCTNYSIEFEKYSECTLIFFKTNSTIKYLETDIIVVKDNIGD